MATPTAGAGCGRRLVAAVLGMALAAFLYGAYIAAYPWLLQGEPLGPGARAQRDGGADALGQLQPVWTGKSYAYLLWPDHPLRPNTTGCIEAPILIDAGSDIRAAAIRAALTARGCTLGDIRHVLLTHGHGHHAAGLMALPHSRVHVAMADGALALGDVGPKNVWIALQQRLEAPVRRPPVPLEWVAGGQRLQLAGHVLTVVALPGHTAGSVGYLVAGGLIAGDAVVGPSLCASRPLAPGSAWHEAPAVAAAVTRRLREAKLAFIADGHTGITRRERCAGTPPPP